jgi:hypothetical protein
MATRYVDPNSTAGGDGTTNALTGANRAYVSLSAWEAARQAVLTEVEEVICSSDDAGSTHAADTAQCIVAGWTTTAAFYIDIKAASTSRASTKWNTNKYRMTYSNVSIVSILDISGAPYCRVDGLQIEVNCAVLEAASRSAVAIVCSPAAGVLGADQRVSNCHIRHIGTLPFNPMTGNAASILGAPSTFGAVPVPNFYIWNNICSWEATGTWTEATYHVGIRIEHRDNNAYIYNNTIRGAWTDGTGGDDNSARLHYVKNNLFSGPVNPTNGSHVNTRCNYNSTNQAALGYTAGANDRVSQTFTFVAADDYALGSGDAGAKDYGLTDPGSGLFSDDINRDTRTAPWDIGADEIVSAGGVSAPTNYQDFIITS